MKVKYTNCFWFTKQIIYKIFNHQFFIMVVKFSPWQSNMYRAEGALMIQPH